MALSILRIALSRPAPMIAVRKRWKSAQVALLESIISEKDVTIERERERERERECDSFTVNVIRFTCFVLGVRFVVQHLSLSPVAVTCLVEFAI